MRRPLVVAAWCLAAMVGQPAAQEIAPEIAGETQGWSLRETLTPDEEYLLSNPAFDILVVRVLEADDRDGTNADPPAVTLEIEEVLRGPSRQGGLPSPPAPLRDACDAMASRRIARARS